MIYLLICKKSTLFKVISTYLKSFVHSYFLLQPKFIYFFSFNVTIWNLVRLQQLLDNCERKTSKWLFSLLCNAVKIYRARHIKAVYIIWCFLNPAQYKTIVLFKQLWILLNEGWKILNYVWYSIAKYRWVNVCFWILR